MPPAAFLHPENAPKSLAAGALPQTQLGELTALLRPPAGLRGPTSKRRGGEGKGGKGRDFGPSQCWRQIDAPVARGRSRSIKMAPTDRSYTT